MWSILFIFPSFKAHFLEFKKIFILVLIIIFALIHLYNTALNSLYWLPSISNIIISLSSVLVLQFKGIIQNFVQYTRLKKIFLKCQFLFLWDNWYFDRKDNDSFIPGFSTSTLLAFWAGELMWLTALCLVGCLATSLVLIRCSWHATIFTRCDNRKYLHML